MKGGVAKTTTSVAVAEILSTVHQKHVLFIDLDPQTNATISLIGEEKWKELSDSKRTLAQLFNDKLSQDSTPSFSVENSIIKKVSTIDGGISRLHLLPSSIEFIKIQEQLPFIAVQGNFGTNPIEILQRALHPIIDAYDYIIIDCPPSLGIVTKNGLRFSTHYIIPTIPDILSTWGIFQIVESIAEFESDVGGKIIPLGIIATKVQKNSTHSNMIEKMKNNRLFPENEKKLKQPNLFTSKIGQRVDTARGVDYEQNPTSLKEKYGKHNALALKNVTEEIIERSK